MSQYFSYFAYIFDIKKIFAYKIAVNKQNTARKSLFIRMMKRKPSVKITKITRLIRYSVITYEILKEIM